MAQESGILNGRDYLVEIDITTPTDAEMGLAYKPLVCEVSSVFNISTGGIEISNGCEGPWATQIPSKSSYSFSGEWQAIDPRTGNPDALSLSQIVDLAFNRTIFWMRRKLKDDALGVEIYREGLVWISNYEEVASVEDPYSFTADFVGVGTPKIFAGYSFIGLLHDSQDAPIKIGNSFIKVKA